LKVGEKLEEEDGYCGWNESATIGYLDGGIGTVETDGFRDGSKKEGGGLCDPREGETKLCVGLAMVETGEADVSGSWLSEGLTAAAAAAAS
jgi:hypothetical protein